ncbi:Exo family class A beta-lactamase [Streptomyces albidoflavus]|uniref:Beta-lactamase n=1 Tax=Streptomyces wadayamensis TaxID=141454 RepID=A0ABR4SA20_9ACTN|nr:MULTISPECIES: Exo family class A beta-lactamase [Streptomyces]AMM09125.1 Beta-lactamase [Streptomyces albidoflavus]KDR62030.1 beta-lactamase [Streptomyces wadayamensis]MCL6278354.1 Exo family class A beta-lactamase [Streptomyces albidoflavus]MCX4464909.1 Exo family class A beta-lactamase [Streptomyces albidoflavus]QXQ26453.1 Exo family class A beta-lactamase [Streptomyces albidoflavus]
MHPSTSRPSRRTLLTATAGAALAAATFVPGTAHASSGGRGHGSGSVSDAERRLAGLERASGARLGVYAYDTGSGRTVAYRPDELFPMCSVFKTLSSAAVLRDLDRNGEFLSRRIFYTQDDVDRADGAPETGKPENLANGMTVEELCEVSITASDNCAANLMLRELGGPDAVTRFVRSLGDRVTRLDRWEPELNSAEPGRVTDTTSPRAMTRTYGRLVLGDALNPRDRRLLTSWLLANTTSGDRFRAGLPDDWTLGDKTGAGRYGTNNDAGVTWPPGRAPIVLTVLTTKTEQDAARDDGLVADAARVLAETLG